MAEINVLSADEVKKSIRSFIIVNFLFGCEDKLENEEESFLENGIIDSTGILELIEYVEEMYHIKVEDEELIPDNFDSLNNVTHYILKKMDDVSI
jgi:acyl carrier protein